MWAMVRHLDEASAASGPHARLEALLQPEACDANADRISTPYMEILKL